MEEGMSEIWSANDEDFLYEDLQELLDAEGDWISEGDTVHVATRGEFDPASFISADFVIEVIGENAYENAGEAAEDFPDVTTEARKELADFLAQWTRKHCKPNFYKVLNSKPYVVTKTDLEK
jgi:hypothetical protein